MLEAGGLVILHADGPASGFARVVAVDQVTGGNHWFLGCCKPIERGETMIVESPVPNDARYVTRASVIASSDETFALRLEPIWERVQQRAFVRISVHGLPVRVVRLATPPRADDEPAVENFDDAVHELMDVSAGGIRFESSDEYEPEEDVVCHFELPGSLCFVLPARIVRSPEDLTRSSSKPSVAVEFTRLDESNRSQLLRWVYSEQVRRHRTNKRQEAKDLERSRIREESRR